MRYRIKETDQIRWGNWQTCSPNFSQFPKDEAYGGLNGGFGTTEFATPISGIQGNQSYDIQFRYDHIAGRDFSGYRILDMKLWLNNDKSETNQIANGRADVSGATWRGSFEGDAQRSTYAAEGGRLWHGEIGDALIDANNMVISASCADCHAESGWDLKYFNYSDESIISRANFHGLSRNEGEKIAQYIRDLPFGRSNNGRPWQPPFQPGPGADTDPFEWAAGQGLENVIDSDEDMLVELFDSKDPTEEQIRNAINDFDGHTNLREQRLSIQFPDWNAWLPVNHPKDMITTQQWNVINNAYNNLKNEVNTAAKVDNLNNRAWVSNNFANNGIYEALATFSMAFHQILGNTYNFPNSPIWANSGNRFSEAQRKSIAAWYSVKLFEVIHEFNLHDIADLQNIPDINEEAFQWPIREWAVFQNAAHVIAQNRGNSYFSTDRTNAERVRGIYLSSAWYQMQLTIAPGNRKNGWVAGNDFAYNLQHVNKLSEWSGIYEPARLLQNYLKTAEQRNTGETPLQASRTKMGWNMRELSPWRLYGNHRAEKFVYEALGDDLRIRIQNVFLDEVVDKLNSFGDNWQRISLSQSMAEQRSDHELEERNARPENGVTNGTGTVFMHGRRIKTDANDAVEINAIYTLLYLLEQDKEISLTVFNKLRDWADARWNFTEWPVYEGEMFENYTLTVRNGSGSGDYTEGANVTIAANVPEGSCFIGWTDPNNALTINARSLERLTFTMPANDVLLTALFDENCGGSDVKYTLAVTNGDGSGEYGVGERIVITARETTDCFTGWSGAVEFMDDVSLREAVVVMPERDISLTALFDENCGGSDVKYALTVTNGDGSGEYGVGERIVITARETTDCFAGWSGAVEFADDVSLRETVVVMPERDISLTALFDENCLITGIELYAPQTIKIYPNPFSATIKIDGIDHDDEVRIYSYQGIEIKKMIDRSVIDLSEYADGMYIIKINGYSYSVMKNQ